MHARKRANFEVASTEDFVDTALVDEGFAVSVYPH
jgi:hypothetical protein